MARSDPVSLARVPAQVRRRRSRDDSDPERPRLRLVVTKGKLGIELDAPFELGPISVTALALSLPGIRFPVELSGGVEAFRHRRGQLEQLELEIEGRTLSRFAPARLSGLLSERPPDVLIAPTEDGLLVGLHDGKSALAFELLVAPLEGDLRLIPFEARGLGLGAPPQALALRATAALVKPYGEVAAGVVVVPDAAALVGRELLPRAGVRAPDGRTIRWSATQFDIGRIRLAAETDGVPQPPSERVLSATQLIALVGEAEDAMLAGRLDHARRAYLGALERAPRHPEIARRAAELDRAVGDRAEAALGTLAEATAPADAGALGALLLADVGDVEAASVALRRAAEGEPYGPLAALLFATLAELGDEEALDRAIARGPSLSSLRWRRFEQQVGASDARRDLEHLEALADGPHGRFEVLRRAAGLYYAQRCFEEAGEAYERALRYLPDSVEAVAGLARSLGSLGHQRRALELLERAAALADRRGAPAHRVQMDLACALVDVAGDRPAAIALVLAVPPHDPHCFEARCLEARWRAALGDLTGASRALGLLAQHTEHALSLLTGRRPDDETDLWGRAGAPFRAQRDARRAIAQYLSEGARLEELDRGDARAAHRLWSMALRLAPQDRQIAEGFRNSAPHLSDAGVAAEPGFAAEPDSRTELTAPAEELPTDEYPTAIAPASVPVIVRDDRDSQQNVVTQRLTAPGLMDLDPVFEGVVDDAALDDEMAVERLSEQLRAKPGDPEIVRELADALERLKRDLDLLALLSASIDESGPEVRGEWVERRRVALARLAEAAEAAGRNGEASLYRQMMETD